MPKAHEQYEITRVEHLDPGTDRFNILYPGKFEIISVRRGLVTFKYVDYGRFTGLVDYMSEKRFAMFEHEALFLKCSFH